MTDDDAIVSDERSKDAEMQEFLVNLLTDVSITKLMAHQIIEKVRTLDGILVSYAWDKGDFDGPTFISDEEKHEQSYDQMTIKLRKPEIAFPPTDECGGMWRPEHDIKKELMVFEPRVTKARELTAKIVHDLALIVKEMDFGVVKDGEIWKRLEAAQCDMDQFKPYVAPSNTIKLTPEQHASMFNKEDDTE